MRRSGLSGRAGSRVRAWAGAGFVMLLASACGSGAPAVVVPSATAGPSSGTVLDRALPASVLDLRLTDAAGETLTLRSLAGTAVVLTDFLTTCQEICPMTSVNLRDVADAALRSGLGAKVRLLEVTVDPERDDPARLAAYQRLYGAARPNWSLLTADPASIASLWRTLGVAYLKTANKAPLPTDWLTGKPLTYDVSHQDVVFLIDGQGRERWLVSGTPSTGGVAPPAVLEHFLNDEGRANLAGPEQPDWTAADVESAVGWLLHHPVR